MAFLPLTEVRLLQNVPLDNTYTDTLTFANATAQETFFGGKAKLVAAELTYQREQKYIAYPAEYDSIINCNYVMYRNPAFSNKWFYAFIVGVEYKNESLSYVHFEVDAYQTFMFDIQIKECFVEREHVSNDAVGANLIEEGLAIGDYVQAAQVIYTFRNWWIVVGATINLLAQGYPDTGGRPYGKVYSGCKFFAFDDGDWVALNSIIEQVAMAGKIDGIVTMYMLPKEIASDSQADRAELQPSEGSPITITAPTIASLQGYVPRNNKLLTYPYRGLSLSNISGTAVTLRYEFFSGTPQFQFAGGISPNSKIEILPVQYQGQAYAYDKMITLGNFPQCTWNRDVYANWLAAKSIEYRYTERKLLANAVQDIGLGAVNSLASLNPSSLLQSVIKTGNNYLDTQNQMSQEREIFSLTPDSVGGSAGSDYTNVTLNRYGFLVTEYTITANVARSIDDYFDMYGYRVNRVKVPNITGRPSWNYVKTQHAKVYGNAPAPYIDQIKAMLNNGVTFWHGDWVGDYSRPNK